MRLRNGGACDSAEVCDGSTNACPADVLATAGTECRASAGGCDVAEVCDGVYTGRGIRSLHGENKARAVVELAAEEDIELGASTAYSDSHTDLPFLEVVGNPVVVNPDRELRRVAEARGWPVLRFTQRAA